MNVRTLFFALLATTFPAAARADTITTFQLQAALDNGFTTGSAGSVGGSVTIDVTTGVVTALNLLASTTAAANGLGATSTQFLTVDNQTADGNFDIYEVQSKSGQNKLALLLHGTSLVGYSGGPLCSYASPCGPFTDSGYGTPNGGVFFDSGNLTPQVAVTPEPSSLLLLGTGLLGMGAVIRRRFALA